MHSDSAGEPWRVCSTIWLLLSRVFVVASGTLAERRGGSHRACQRSVLARREAAGERRGVIVHRTTACRWRSHLADDNRTTDTSEARLTDGYVSARSMTAASNAHARAPL
jgi:hypothetical protein